MSSPAAAQPSKNAGRRRRAAKLPTTTNKDVNRLTQAERNIEKVLNTLPERIAQTIKAANKTAKKKRAPSARPALPRAPSREAINAPAIIQAPVSEGAAMPVVNPTETLMQHVREDEFQKSGCSAYCLSLLLPAEGAASVPDDVMRLHQTRSELVSNSVTIPPLDSPGTNVTSGIIILYPNHPTSLIGYVYFYNDGDDVGTEGWDYNSSGTESAPIVLTTATELSTLYDYGRRTSQMLELKCATATIGTVAISGLFNAARIEGTVSELSIQNSSPLQIYSTITANTQNVTDKIVEVPVFSGIVSLSLPDSLVAPYMRLADSTPATATIGVVLNTTITDSQQDLVVKAFLSSPGMVQPPSTFYTFSAATFNFDSTNGAHLQVDVSLNLTFPDPGAPVATVETVLCEVLFLDPFGLTVAAQQQTQVAIVQFDSTGGTGVLVAISYNFTVLPDYTKGPIAAISLILSATNNTTVGAADTTGSAAITVTATAPNGARTGVNNPVTIVVFTGMQPTSQLAIGGTANFELVPNPNTRKIVQTEYLSKGQFDYDEFNYVKMVMANRNKYGIRTLWNGHDYRESKHLLAEIACSRTHTPNAPRSEGLAWSDIGRFVKKGFNAVAPLVGGIAPESAPILAAIRSLMSDAASGAVITARGADGFRLDPGELVVPFPIDDFEFILAELESWLRPDGIDAPWYWFSTDTKVQALYVELVGKSPNAIDYFLNWFNAKKFTVVAYHADDDVSAFGGLRRADIMFMHPAGVAYGKFVPAEEPTIVGFDPYFNDPIDTLHLYLGLQTISSSPVRHVATPTIPAPPSRRQQKAAATKQSRVVAPAYNSQAAKHFAPPVRSVIFPTVSVDSVGNEVGFGLYCARTGRHGQYLARRPPIGYDSVGHTLFGYNTDVPFNLGTDVTVFPIDPKSYAGGDIVPLVPTMLVEGESAFPALYFLTHGNFRGLYPVPITGRLSFADGKPVLTDFPSTLLKLRDLHVTGLPIAAANRDADVPIFDFAGFCAKPSVLRKK